MEHNRTVFLHERLEAYVFARKFYQTARAIREQLPRGLGEVRVQLYRASSSVTLAIAEGANASQIKIKSMHFTRALASAGECAAALDQIEDECAAPESIVTKARSELRRCMLLTLGLRR